MNVARTPSRLQRELVTPEGLALPLTLASRGARAGALLLDLLVILVAVIVFIIVLGMVGIGVMGADMENATPAVEVVLVLLILLLFFSRFGYFLFFELGPRGATPGKRALGIRVAAGSPFQLGDAQEPYVRVTVGALRDEVEAVGAALAVAQNA